MNKFIVIDDSKINNLISRVIISKSFPGCIVEEFTDASEGLKYIKDHCQQIGCNENIILFLDIYMPIMDGWSFLNEFDKLSDRVKNNITIYMLTSSISQEDIDTAAKNVNIKGFVTKPLEESFKAIINSNMAMAV